MLTLISYNSSTFGGHYGIALSGLEKKSCFLHMHAQPADPYPKHKFALISKDGLYSNITHRYCFPTIEDGNKLGLSETSTLEYWRYYKYKTYNQDKKNWNTFNVTSTFTSKNGKIFEKIGRQTVFDNKYNMMSHNCVLLANRLLKASMLKVRQSLDREKSYQLDFNNLNLPQLNYANDFELRLKMGTHHISYFLLKFAARLQYLVFEAIFKSNVKPIYGINLESSDKSKFNLSTFDSPYDYYSPSDNLENGKQILGGRNSRSKYILDEYKRNEISSQDKKDFFKNDGFYKTKKSFQNENYKFKNQDYIEKFNSPAFINRINALKLNENNRNINISEMQIIFSRLSL
jgi:hypothetical protein